MNYNQPGVQKPQHPGKAKPAAIAIIIVIIIAALCVVWYLQASPPVTPDKQPPANEYAAMERKLAEGTRIDLASPDRTRWNNGDTGIFKLGIRNQYDETRTYYMNIYLEELRAELEGTPVSEMAEETSEWFTYQDSVDIEPSGTETLTITMDVPQVASRGSYSFRIIVCEEPDCTDLLSSDPYDSTNIPIYVKG
jgi:hypothetical protein